MFQQIIALIIIAFILFWLIWKKKKEQIGGSEFRFWVIFWVIAGTLVIFLKKIDQIVAELGFSGSGIEVLLYLTVVILFYFIFRLRLRIVKIEREITKIVREIALKEKNN